MYHHVFVSLCSLGGLDESDADVGGYQSIVERFAGPSTAGNQGRRRMPGTSLVTGAPAGGLLCSRLCKNK